MYNDLYNEMIVVLTLLLLIYALTIPLILNTDDKIKHVKWSALGLKNVLKSCEQKDIESISKEAQLLYDEYMQEKPSASNWRFRCTCSGRIFFPGALSSTKAMRPWGSSTNLSGIPSYPGETNLGQIPPLCFTACTSCCSIIFSRMISSVRVFSIDFSSRCVTPPTPGYYNFL